MSHAAAHPTRGAGAPPSATPLVALAVAGALAAAWLSLPSPEELAFMRYKDGDFTGAAGMYERQLANGDDSARVLAPLARIYMAQGDAERAARLLETHGADGPADVGAHELLAEAYRLAEREGDYLRELVWLSEAAPTAERLRALAWLYERRGDEEHQLAVLQQLVTHHPGNAGDRVRLAHLLVRRGDTVAGERALAVIGPRALAGLDAAERTGRFQVLLAAGHLEQAAADLSARAADSATPPQSFTDLAQAYLDAARPADGLPHLTLMRALRPLPESDAAWARLAAAAGNGAQVAAWLQEGGEASPALLDDLYHLGADSGQPALALAAAERRLATDSGPGAQRRMALALLAAGRDEEALPRLRALAPADDADAALYRATLERTGRTTELAAWLHTNAADRRTPSDKRRETAFDLLAMGQRDAAVELFRALAGNAPPDDPDVRELLYLWGPRPGPEALDWLAERAGRAGRGERLVWLQTLLELGGAARVVDFMDREGGPSDPGATLLHLRALAQTGDTGRLDTLVRGYLPAESDPEQLRRFAQLAGEGGSTATAQAAWERLLQVAPHDPGALLHLGLAAASRQDDDATASLLGAYLEQRPGDLEAHYACATALTRMDRFTEAAAHYRATVRLAGTDIPPTERLAVANSLDRLGRTDEAVAAFEALRREDPSDQGVLGEYAAMLYRNGMLERFRKVTEGRQP